MLTEPIRELAGRIAAIAEGERATAHGEGVEINHVVSAAATTYERIRYLLEYREEHTIRRSAIERILKRRVLIEHKTIDGPLLLRELVEGRYVSSEKTGHHEEQTITGIVERFLRLRDAVGDEYGKQFLSFAASEIEAHLEEKQHAFDASVTDAFYKTLRPHVQAPGYTPHEIDTQLFAACRRALLNSDDETLAYTLWLAYVPGWKDRKEDAERTIAEAPAIIRALRRDLKHPLQWQIVPRIKNESIYFRIIRDIVMERGSRAGETLESPEKIEAFTHEFLEGVYAHERTRMRSSGIRAVIYLFCTKFIITLVAELPYELFILGGINYVPLLTNIIFHPALLFVLTRGTGSLGPANTNAIVKGLQGILYRGEERAVHVGASSPAFAPVFAALYLLLILGVFGGIIGILQALQFNIVGAGLFLFFLALVSYFAFRIRWRARRWVVIEDRGVAGLITNALMVPVVRVGRWLSRTFSSINIFVMLLDFIIETPFKMLLNFSHHFIIYLREKANEVY